MADITVDLVSDTATRPGAAMREAMAHALVGDEQRGEDPSVNELNARVAELLGQEASIFLPSGTMCNQIALAVHCRPGDQIIAADSAHIITSEGAGAAVFAGSMVRAIACDRGIFSADELRSAMGGAGVKAPRPRVVAVEQTSNRGGGTIWPLDILAEVVEAARELNCRLHMDGARLMNAVIATGVEAHRYAAPFDSVWIDLSKGLGCPVGGVLAGSAAFIAEATVWKHRFGGAMRQAGILAAAGLYALDHNIERLANDHENARAFASRLAALPGVSLQNREIETNLVFFDVSGTGLTAPEISSQLRKQGVRIGVESKYLMRAVFHLDVRAEAVGLAADALAHALALNE